MRCAQGHFAPNDQFNLKIGRKSGSCNRCLERRRNTDKLRRERQKKQRDKEVLKVCRMHAKVTVALSDLITANRETVLQLSKGPGK